jgi:hypothetical protein
MHFQSYNFGVQASYRFSLLSSFFFLLAIASGQTKSLSTPTPLTAGY